jgi:cytochrome c peroxidase
MLRTIVMCALCFSSMALAEGRIPLGLPAVPVPANNPQTPEKIALGKRLFSDKRLSVDGSISCAECHLADKAFADGRAVAEGVRKRTGTRNTPTLWNVAYFTSQFWDGRRDTLETQAKDPFVNPVEHGFAGQQAVLNIVRDDADYVAQFKKVFDAEKNAITMDHVAMAIAAFERTLIAGDAPFDRFFFAGRRDAMTPAAQRGLALFRGRAGCATCHTIDKKYALFTDNLFHSAGVGFNRIQSRLAEITTRFMKSKGEATASLSDGRPLDAAVLTDADLSELGRFVVTGDPGDLGKFKTPTLRNVALTAPYMHDGSVASLLEVIEIELYVRGAETQRPVILTPDEKNDLVEFLHALTSSEANR